MNTFQQVEFKNDNKRMICWTDRIDELKPGNICELKQVTGLWEVVEIFPAKMNKIDIKQTWRVGGLT